MDGAHQACMRYLRISILARIRSSLLKGILWWLPLIIKGLGVCTKHSFWRKPKPQLHPQNTLSIFKLQLSLHPLWQKLVWTATSVCGCHVFSFFSELLLPANVDNRLRHINMLMQRSHDIRLGEVWTLYKGSKDWNFPDHGKNHR